MRYKTIPDFKHKFYNKDGNITAENLKKYLAYCNSLPMLYKEAVNVRNRKGLLVGRISKRGVFKYFGVVSYQNRIIYFDGNRLGKRKEREVWNFFRATGAFSKKVSNKIGASL